MKSVIEKLKTLFPETKIRLGSMEEEEKESCFVVGISQVSEKCVNAKRYRCIIKIFINYFPKGEEALYQERYHILELLMQNLDSVFLENGATIGSNDRSGTVENGNLKFQMEYQIFYLKNQAEEMTMEDIRIK
jgi:hypothetical protein